MVERQRCYRIKCLLGCEGYRLEWLGWNRGELWAVCARCGKPRLKMSELNCPPLETET